ncbi:MAG: redoxin domain-containing protein [Planctomycetes bacterium]|nr:redoxin domain-containing protein [Planctomycetota bacterium]
MRKLKTSIGIATAGVAPRHLALGARGFPRLVALGALAALIAVAAWTSQAAALMKPEVKTTDVPATRIPADPNAKPGEPAPEQPKPPVPEGPIPVAKCDEPTKDFGETWMGPTLTHAFIIKNEGQAPLEITKVRPACGCTVAGEHPKVLEPGKSGEFPFSINSTKLRGKYEKAITISTNDPVNPDLKLKLAGVVKRYVDVLPTNAIFGKISDEGPQERVLKITNNTDRNLEIKANPTEDGPFKFEVVTTTPNKEYELKVTMAPPFKPGEYRNTTTITTNISEQESIIVTATASVPERIEIQPAAVTLNPAATSDKPYTRPIRITNYGKDPVKVLEATVDDPALKVLVNERTEGKAYTVNLEVPAGYQAPATLPKITLKTTDKEKETVVIPINAAPQVADANKRPPTRPAEQLVGQPAPTFSINTTDGKPVSNATLKDAITVVDFFAPNCGFCKKQIPMLENVRKEYVDKGVRFVSISQTMRKTFTDDEVKEVLKGTGFQGELAMDHANTIGPLFNANSYPTLVVLGKSGKVEAVTVGAAADFESRLKGQLDALIAGKPLPTPPPTAEAPPQQPQQRPAEAMVGKEAPKFSASTTEGKEFSNASLAQAITVADFWAPNCGFCKKQLPNLEKVRKEYVAKGVRFVAVSQTMRQNFEDAQVKETLKGTGFEGELVIDSANSIGPLFQATSFPTMVVMGKSGKIEAVNIGAVADLETRLKAQLDALLEGKPMPKVEAPTAAAPPQATPESLVGKKAPAFDLATVDGKKLGSSDFANHPATVLTFVAPNCGFCKKAVPVIETVRAEYEAKGVRFVNVAQTMRKEFTQQETVEVFKTAGSNIELAYDPKNTVGPLYNANGFPTMVVVDKSGNIAHVNVGAKPDLDTVLKGQLDGLIAGKPAGEAGGKRDPVAVP